jgi:hypothetical protein
MAMQRARRLASAAVVASLAVAGLSACRSGHDVAAYIGDRQITADRVTGVYDEVQRSVAAAGPVPAGQIPPTPVTRADVLGVLLGAELLPEVARQQNVTLPADTSVDRYAAGIRLQPDLEYTKLFAQANAYSEALLQKTTPPAGQPSDADLREVYDAISAAARRAGQDAGTFEQFKGGLADQGKQAVQAASSVRAEINQAAGKMDIKINPRYGAAAVPVLSTITQSGDYILLLRAPIADQDEVAPVSAAH